MKKAMSSRAADEDKLYDLRDSVEKRLLAAAHRSPKLDYWLEEDANIDAIYAVTDRVVTSRFLKDDDEDARVLLQEQVDNLGEDLDDFNEDKHGKAWVDYDDRLKEAEELVEKYKNLEAEITLSSVPGIQKVQDAFAALESAYADVQEYIKLVKADFMVALDRANDDIAVLAKLGRNDYEKITKTTGKGKTAKTTVMQGRSYKEIAAAIQESLDVATAALADVSALTGGKSGVLEYRSRWGSSAWAQLEDAKGEFSEYDESKPEVMAGVARTDFDQANVWLAVAKRDSPMLGDWETATVLASHGRLEHPRNVAEVLAKWAEAMREDEALAEMLRREWSWLKHLYDEKVAGTVVPRAPTASMAPKAAPATGVPSFQAWLQNELDKEATTRVAILRKAIEAIEAATPTPPVGVSKLQAFLAKTHTKKDARALHTDYRTSLPAYNKVMSGDWLKWEMEKRGERLAGLEDVYERLYKRAIPPGERAAAYKLTPRVAPIPGVVQL